MSPLHSEHVQDIGQSTAAQAQGHASPRAFQPEATVSTTQRLLSRLDRRCLSIIADRLRGAEMHLRLWDGTTVSLSELPPVGTVIIKNRATLWRLIARPELGFGEAYAGGRIEVIGDLMRMIESVNLALAAARPREASPDFDRRPRATALASSRQNVHHHYDLGNDFYRLWLDEAMVYTCAYFDQPHIGLEAAQQSKLDYVCRKLDLRPGDRVIEAGCGWGALAVYMAKRYQAKVHAYNISKEQLEYAREDAKRQGVADRVTFIDGDFRSITGECDAFVSVGMLEHVGPAEYRTLGQLIDRVVDSRRGRGLLHFIGRSHPQKFDAWIQRYIFPGAYPPVLSEVTGSVFEPWNLSVCDVENLRQHYATTLRHWRARYEKAATRVAEMFDDQFVRMWRLYLAGSEAAFTSGDLQLFQVTFGRATDNAGRWTRADLYSTQQTAGQQGQA